MRLTEADIRLLRYEKRFGYILAVLIISLGALFNLFYFVAFAERTWLLIIPVDVAIVLFAFLVQFFINRKLNKDLRADNRIKKVAVVGAKQSEPAFLPVSRGLRTEVIGNRLPDTLKLKDDLSEKYFLIVNHHRFEVSRALYRNVEPGDGVNMYYSAFSDTYLGMEARPKIFN